MINFNKWFIIIFGLFLILMSHFYSGFIDNTYNHFRFSFNHILNEKFDMWLSETKSETENKIFSEAIKESWITDIRNPNLQNLILDKVSKVKKFTWTQLIQSLILWFLYWYAYMATIVKVRKNYMPIDVKSFLTFSLTSWWMVLVNWFIPWSLVYLESFILAWYAVFLHLKNQINWKEYNKNY